MKIETTPIENHQVKMTVEVDAQLLEDAKRRGARNIARKVKIPGFRPGKAPYAVILRQYGEGPILEEAVDLLANEIYPKALDEAGVQPYGPGTLQDIPTKEPLTLEFVIPLKAEATLMDYKSILRDYNPPTVNDDEVNQTLQDLRSRNAELEPVERPAVETDLVSLRIKATKTPPDVFSLEESDPILIREWTTQVVISEETEDGAQVEWPFSGFSRHFIGAIAGQVGTFTHSFADDSPYETFRGIDALFEYEVIEVKSRKLPELNDEFAATLGEYKSLNELQSDIRINLENRKSTSYNSEYDEAVITEIMAGSEYQYPDQMLKREIDEMLHDLEHRLSEQKLDMDLYLKTRQMSSDDLRAELKPVAESRIKRTLTLSKIAELEKIQITPDELQAETSRTMSSLVQFLPKNEAKRLTNRDVLNNLISNVMVDLMANHTLERIRQIASGQVVNPPSEDDKQQLTSEGETEPAVEPGETVEQVPVAQAEETPSENL